MDWYNSIKNEKNIIKIYESIFKQLKKHTSIILNSDEEINKTKLKRKFYTIKVDTDEKIDLLGKYLIFYYLLAQNNYKNLIASLDFEFNTKIIALMQICFEWDNNEIFIFVFYPPDLDSVYIRALIKILTHKNITKILHGAEALDIPYVFDELLQRKKYIKKFLRNMIDTRFYCEYYNYVKKFPERKCKIYYLLKDFNIITQKKLDDLNKNGEEMGNISDIIIDVRKMSDALLKYSLYDVIFLKDLYLSFPLNDEYYKFILPEITALSYLNNRKLSKSIIDLNLLINKINNYYTIKNNNRVTLISFFKHEYTKLKNNILVLLAENVKYFKKTIIIFLKYFIYKKKLDKYIFNKNKNEKYRNELNSELIVRLKKYPHLYKLYYKIYEYNFSLSKTI